MQMEIVMSRRLLYCSDREYGRYLDRHAWEGEGEPLDREEFCRLQDELMGLLADRASGGLLSPEQRRRVRELRRILLSDI